MFNFADGIKTEINNMKTYTDNGALAYATAGDALTDYMFATTALRNSDDNTIKKEFSRVYFEDPMIANKFSFYSRDVRGGMGERKIFHAYLMWLADNKPEVCKSIIPLVPEYGRWDDLWCLLHTKMKDDVCALVNKQLEEDMENAMSNKGVSLLAKWMPSISGSSKETRKDAQIIREYLGITDRQYRKTLSRLRQYLDVVEVKMTDNRWDEINYETVPSQANNIYKDAFMRHDETRRLEYLNSLKKGETKINASTLQPHEIVARYLSGRYWSTVVKEYDETLEQLWKALPIKSLDNCLVVRDGSGSMTGGYGTNVRPLDVATSLAVYMADHNHGIWKGKFITFSENPKIVDITKCKDLHDKLVKTYNEDDCSNTDIEKTMMLILRTAIKNHCKQEDMPASILIVSDMQFDSATYQYRYGYQSDNTLQTLFENIADRYEAAGYKLPKMIFWNVAGQLNKTIPMQKNDLGVILISGFSVQLLDMVMSGETDPYQAILKTINSERYQPIEDAVKSVL